jgi:hypothetical protein
MSEVMLDPPDESNHLPPSLTSDSQGMIDKIMVNSLSFRVVHYIETVNWETVFQFLL